MRNVTVCTDGFSLIEADDVDERFIASHDSTHAELVLAAVKAGKPVLCEEPWPPRRRRHGRWWTPRSPLAAG